MAPRDRLYSPIEVDPELVKRALKDPLGFSKSGHPGEENGPRSVPAIGCLQALFASFSSSPRGSKRVYTVRGQPFYERNTSYLSRSIRTF